MNEYINQEAFDRAAEAVRKLIELVQEAVERIENIVKDIRCERLDKQPFPIPPRRILACGLARPQRIWWVNYKARDKLRPNGLKLANRGGLHHGKKRKANHA